MCVYPKTLGENTDYMVLNTVKYISVNLLLIWKVENILFSIRFASKFC